MDKIDLLAIGDIVNDDFIELDEQYTRLQKIDGESYISISLGYKLPYKDRKLVMAVGNSPNAACSATRLGLNTGLMTHIGDDELGERTLQALKNNNINTQFVTIEEGKKTNYHFVLRFGAERTILIKHEEYTYNLQKQIEGKPTPEWAYFSSVGKNSIQYHKDIADWVKENNIKLVFQPGSFQIELGYEPIKEIYETTQIYFLNVEEAYMVLSRVYGKDELDKIKDNKSRPEYVKEMMRMFQNLGVKIVCVTDGPEGAYAMDETGDAYFIKPYPDPKDPVDRTGAGDSFSSTFTSAIILGKDIREALMWGPINSMSVVQYIGAQEGLLTREKLEEYLNNAPDYYHPQKI